MPGYYDNQGVWIHAEDDTFPSMSEALNRSPKSISDALKPFLTILPMARDAASRAEQAALMTDPLVAPFDDGTAALITTTTSSTRTALDDHFDAKLSADFGAEFGAEFDARLPVPVAFTPLWTSSGTAPALGNGTLTGRYARHGKIIVGRLTLIAGSTTTFGSGAYRFSLPAAAAAGTQPVGSALVYDSSTFNQWQTMAICGWSGGTASQIVLPRGNGTSATVDAADPVALAAGDQIMVEFSYLSV